MISLETESKMIPMDFIDELRKNDLLTMSQLMKYDSQQNPRDFVK